MQYVAIAERQTASKLDTFTLDNGSEFINKVMEDYCNEHGISLHTTAPYTPEQNGVAERRNRTIITRARSLMLQSGVPSTFWYQACLTSNFIGNRLITAALPDNKTPYEVWRFRKPSVAHLRVFGCLVHRVIRKELREDFFLLLKLIIIMFA